MPDQPAASFVPPKELKMFPCDRQLAIARFSPCGNFLAAGALEGTMRRWSVVEKKKPAPAPAAAAAADIDLLDDAPKKTAPKNTKPAKAAKPPPEESPVELVPLPHLTGFNGWVQNLAFHPKEKVLYVADTWASSSPLPTKATRQSPCGKTPPRTTAGFAASPSRPTASTSRRAAATSSSASGPPLASSSPSTARPRTCSP